VVPRVIVYRAIGALNRLAAVLIALGLLFVAVASATSSLGESHLLCRGKACELTSSHLILPDGRETIPAAAIREVRIRESKAKNRTYYVAVLVTKDREIELGRETYDQSAVSRVREQIEAFLEDPARTVDTEVETRNVPGALMMLALFAGPSLLVLWLVTAHTRIVVDRAEGELLIERVRWPLPSSRESRSLRDVSHAAVEVEPKGAASVSLVLASGERIALVGYKSPGAHHEAAASAINEALTAALP